MFSVEYIRNLPPDSATTMVLSIERDAIRMFSIGTGVLSSSLCPEEDAERNLHIIRDNARRQSNAKRDLTWILPGFQRKPSWRYPSLPLGCILKNKVLVLKKTANCLILV